MYAENRLCLEPRLSTEGPDEAHECARYQESNTNVTIVHVGRPVNGVLTGAWRMELRDHTVFALRSCTSRPHCLE